MRSLPLLFVSFLTAHTIAQATVTEYVTIEPSSTISTPFVASVPHKQAQSTPSASATGAASQTTLATVARVTSTTSSASLIQSTSPVSLSSSAASTTAASSSSGDYNGGDNSAGDSVDTDAGASGSGSSFSVSKGGLIAIIVVVVVVAVFGIASTVLFVMAKRRQWNIRASIARASRRLTGRFGDSSRNAPRASNRRTTVNAGRLGGDVKAVRPPGHKRGMVVEVNDVEKGPLNGRAPTNKKPREYSWVQRLWGNDWK